MKTAFQPVLEVLAPLEPLFSGIGSALSGLCSWFSELITPVQSSTEALNAWASAGEIVGKVIGTAFNIVLLPIMAVVQAIGLVIQGMQWLYANSGKISEAIGSVQKNNLESMGITGIEPPKPGEQSLLGKAMNDLFGSKEAALVQPGEALRQAEKALPPSIFTQPLAPTSIPTLTPRPVPSLRNVTNTTTFNPTINITAPAGADSNHLATLVENKLRGMMPSMLPDTSGMLYD